VYLFDGLQPGRLLKKIDFDYEVASAAVNSDSGRLVTGNAGDTWARVYDLHTEEELGMSFLLLIHQSFFRPDGLTDVRLQKCKRATTAQFGQSASRLTASSTALVVKTALSSCGRRVGSRMVFGGEMQRLPREEKKELPDILLSAYSRLGRKAVVFIWCLLNTSPMSSNMAQASSLFLCT